MWFNFIHKYVTTFNNKRTCFITTFLEMTRTYECIIRIEAIVNSIDYPNKLTSPFFMYFSLWYFKETRAGYPVFEAYVGQSTIQQFAPGIEKELVIKFDDIHFILP